ncbi:MAG TPA: TlpA disulfide reductase family protein [Pyrinomonadaceae bacterium]|nr:TlpA disulfide reductase family protein [Pyrinomonadaceae bacterium]
MSNEKQPARIPKLALMLILALVVINVLLLVQNLSLRRQLSSAGRLDASANALKPGELVTSITGKDLNGQPYQVEYVNGGRKQLLMFFSPSCQYCVQQAPGWRDVLNQIDSNRFNVVGIVGDREDKQEVTQHADGLGYFKTKVALPVVAVNSETLARYKLTATPTTLLIDSSGKVEHAWVGKWDEAKTAEVAAALK